MTVCSVRRTLGQLCTPEGSVRLGHLSIELILAGSDAEVHSNNIYRDQVQTILLRSAITIEKFPWDACNSACSIDRRFQLHRLHKLHFFQLADESTCHCLASLSCRCVCLLMYAIACNSCMRVDIRFSMLAVCRKLKKIIDRMKQAFHEGLQALLCYIEELVSFQDSPSMDTYYYIISSDYYASRYCQCM